MAQDTYSHSKSWRRKSTEALRRLAKGIEFLSPALLRTEDLRAIHGDQYSDPREVEQWTRAASEGLWPEELALIPPLPGPGARAVVLGCGAGREALDLARRGWRVTGIDLSPELLAAARSFALKEGLSVEWSRQDLAEQLRMTGPVQLFCLFNSLYNLIPTYRRRVALLSECRRVIAEDGRCAIRFGGGAVLTPRLMAAHRWRRRLAQAVGGNRELQPGDRLNNGCYLQHNFTSEEEVAQEAAEAGWKLIPSQESWLPYSVVLAPQ